MRPLPLVVPETEAFWTGGRDGRLVVKRCPECGRLWHPSATVCGECQARELAPAEVSGRATVVGCTVNLQQWLPDPAPPYVVAIVALDEDPRVRLTTNVIDVEPEAVTIGLRVEVRFEEQDDVWLPLFAPSGDVDRRCGCRCGAGVARGERAPDGARRQVRGPGRDHRNRHVGRRPAAHAEPARPDARRLPRRPSPTPG